ncbi:hypothetical protein Tco_1508449, partial [Tanacetum coccineum]
MEQKNPQQAALDEALVPIVDQVKINSFNMRIDPTKKQKEATYQVTLDILKLSSCYNAFLIITDEFVEPPPHDALVSFLKQLGYKGSLELVSDMYIDHMYQPWRAFLNIINKCLSRKKSDFQYQFDNRHSSANRREHIPYPRFTKVIIHYFLLKHGSIPKRHGSLIHTIKYDAVLGKLKFVSKGEEEQKKPSKLADLTTESNNNPKAQVTQVPDEPNDISGSSSSSSSGSDNETKDISSDDKVKDDDYKADEEMKDAENDKSEKAKEDHPVVPNPRSSLILSSAEYGNQFLNVSSNTSLVGILKDPTKIEIQSMVDVLIHQEDSAVLRTPLVDTVISMVIEKTTPTPTQIPPTTEAQVTPVSKFDPSLKFEQRFFKLEKKVEALSKVNQAEAIEESVQANLINEVKNQLPKLIPKVVSDYVKPRLESTAHDMQQSGSFQEHQKRLDLYNALIGSIGLDEAIAKGEINPAKVLKKRRCDDKDEDPPAKSDKEKKRRKQKDFEPSKDDQAGSSKKSNTPSKSSKTDNLPETPDLEWQKEPNADDGPEYNWFNELVNEEKDPLTFDDLMGTCRSNIVLEYNLEQCYLALSDQLDWTNPEGDKCLVDIRKPLPLRGPPGHLTIIVDFFFNNDLEYLKTGNKERKYIVSLTKTKAARYDLKDIEDMIPKLWSTVKEAYDKYVALGIYHWGPKRQLFYRSRIAAKSPHKSGAPQHFTVMNGNPSGISIKQHYDVSVMRTSKYGESDASTLENLILQTGNHVREILLKLNLPYYRFNQRWRFPIPSESNSQATCSYLIDKYKHMMKFQVHVTKSSATLIPNVFLEVM